jgi:pimeloyl-ACP methyl ester carboxylesterase
MSENPEIEWRVDDLVLEDVRLHYQRGGAGSPVLLLHGLSDAGTTWKQVARVLARTHDVIVLDQRGHGLSSAPPTGYAIEDFVADAARVITALEIVPTAVVGHSLGGLIALHLAASHPYLVSRLVMEDPPLLADWMADGAAPHEINAAREAWFAPVIEVRSMAPDERLRHIQSRSPGWTPSECSDWVDSKLSMSPRLWQAGGVDLRGDWQAALRRIHCPVLLVRGDVERGSLLNEAREHEVLALTGQAQAVHIPGASHTIHKGTSAEFLSVLAPFLEGGRQTAELPRRHDDQKRS